MRIYIKYEYFTKERLYMWHAKDIRDIEVNFRTNREYGITKDEAQKRLEYFGKNILKDSSKQGKGLSKVGETAV